MTAPLRLDGRRAAAAAVARIGQDPDLAGQLARYAGSARTWRIRASLDDDGMVTLTAMVGDGARVGLGSVPRRMVEIER